MSTSTTETPMSISGLATIIADPPASIGYPTAAPSPPAAFVTYCDSVAPPPTPALGPPAGTDRFPPLFAAHPAPFEFRAPFTEQRTLDQRVVGELMPAVLCGTAAAGPCRPAPAAEPRESPAQARLSTSSVPGSPTQAGLVASSAGSLIQAKTCESAPTLRPHVPPAPTTSSTSIPGSRPPSSMRGGNRRTSLFSADGLADGTSTPIPYHPSSSLYTGFNNTPTPDEASGFIQGLNRYELFEIVHPETLCEWEAVTGPKIIVFIANDTVTTEIHHRVTLIRKALTAIFPDVDPVIGSAAVSGVTGIAHQPVFPFLVHQIPEPYARRLILQHCWTINGFSFFALHFALPVTSYVMTLAGLHLPAQLESNDIVATLVRRWLRNSHSVDSFIRDHHDNLPTFMSVDEQIEFTLDTVEIKHVKLGNAKDDSVAFNAYIYPPTNDPFHHQSWLKAVRAITYYAACGTGKAVSIFNCKVCKGRDHSSDSCSFPVNQSCKISPGMEGTLPIMYSGRNTYEGAERLGGLSVNGINFNYFTR